MKASLARTFIRVAGTCLLLGLGIRAGMAGSQSALAATACSTAALSAFNVRGVSIASTAEMAAAPNARAYCRVIGSVRTDGEGAGVNQVRFQLNLPASWNGKFLHLLWKRTVLTVALMDSEVSGNSSQRGCATGGSR